MSLVTALVAGGAVGVRHALEADHVAAVATLVEDEGERPGLVGASWGVGHTIPIAAVGLLFVALGVRLPEPVTRLFEALVGLVLVYLGVRLLADVLGVVAVEAHGHGGDVHAHLRVGSVSLGSTHLHLDGDSALVGLVHGFAGSGALVVGMVATAPTVDTAVAFLAAFGLLSVLTMGAVSVVWGRALGSGLAGHLKGGAALVSVGVGLLLLWEQVGAVF